MEKTLILWTTWHILSHPTFLTPFPWQYTPKTNSYLSQSWKNVPVTSTLEWVMNSSQEHSCTTIMDDVDSPNACALRFTGLLITHTCLSLYTHTRDYERIHSGLEAIARYVSAWPFPSHCYCPVLSTCFWLNIACDSFVCWSFRPVPVDQLWTLPIDLDLFARFTERSLHPNLLHCVWQCHPVCMSKIIIIKTKQPLFILQLHM